jgi:hypothetical protein
LLTTHHERGHLKVLDSRHRASPRRRRQRDAHRSHARHDQLHGAEQIHARPDGRADVLVGATMFRLLAKRKIHEAESEAEFW